MDNNTKFNTYIKALLKSATKLMSVHGFTCLDDFKGTVIIDAGKGLQKGVMEFMPNCCIADCISNFQFYFELSTLMKKQELFDEILCCVIFILKN